MLGSLTNLDTLGKWSLPVIRFVAPSSGLNFLVSFFAFFLSPLLTFSLFIVIVFALFRKYLASSGYQLLGFPAISVFTLIASFCYT